MENGVVIFVVAVLIVAVMLLLAIKLTGKRNHKFNIEEYQTRFLRIENRLNKNNSATFALSIINADKLLDRAMHEAGIPGKTMGDRLKKAGGRFTNIDAVWRAHKLRNAIAHEDDLEITYRQAASALLIYKQALKDLGAI
ncbi:hypothetical protein IKF02_00605 [Candidatus Saccharibacteria bacterium]|nr:hypothetical protein [Candidatus Saccharibacteria bacterium]